ncbi:MAG: sortase [Clostridia bacterium]|nr:sortase [Clostridia bacterium]
MEGKYSKFLTILLIVIIVGVVGLLGYLGFNYFRDNNTEQDAAEFVQTFTDSTSEVDANKTETPSEVADNSAQVDVSEVDGSSSKGKKKMYKGFEVLGTIEIPKTNVKYPILAKVTRKSLETSVAVLYPKKPVLNSKGNVVIIGHNYRNGLFFSNNKKLSNGDKIYITDLNGKKMTYSIYKTFQASEDDTSFYNRDTKGAVEITLSTCTDDSSARTIIQAKAE